VWTERRSIGRRSASGGCAQPSSANSGGQRCVTYRSLTGTRTVKGRKGVNRVTISGVLAGRRLSAGDYRVVVRATGGNTRRLAFKVGRR